MSPPFTPRPAPNAPIAATTSTAAGAPAPAARTERPREPVPSPAGRAAGALPAKPADTGRPAAVPAAKASPAALPSAEQLQQAVAEVRKVVEARAPNEIAFSVDQDTGRTVVRVIDRKTGDTIYQIPAQEMLEIAKSLDRMQGLLLKRKA